MRAWIVSALLILAGCSPPSSADNDLGAGGRPGPGPGGHGSWLVGTGGLVVNALTWTSFQTGSSGTNADLFALYCVGHSHGWAAGAEGTLISTLDGGESWEWRTTGVDATLRAVAFADFGTGLLVGDDGTLLRSTDGGASWTHVSARSATLRAVAMSGAAAWVVGDAGTVLRSKDGGASFTRVGGVPAIDFTGVRFAAGAMTGFVTAGDGTLWRTTDGGMHFAPIAHASQPLAGLSVSHDGARVVAVGAGGVILRSTDGGAHVAELSGGTSLDLAAVGFGDDEPDNGLAVGQHGTILLTRDGGATWEAMPSPSQADYAAIEDF